ncbi:dephospho-CoA kinase/protein folding accessory domain-containing protein [Staphylococcus gallinarum]|uniref:Dephospho-CoA kinase/protein folding accessory domain-containing protein n=1 Tax=Staphylococcus gallinarum TaxID=1293 RepID=A0A380FCZ6_STAGA|nr:dephospho-CoA kinase/protein folding accessory domain-containing protein [Staphylococcus gallinarum]
MRTIEVMPYDVAWKEAFSREQVQLAKLFNNEVVDIYHIGSTSVPNLYAKPIIDILVVVNNIKAVDHYNQGMFELGYAAKGENGIKKP